MKPKCPKCNYKGMVRYRIKTKDWTCGHCGTDWVIKDGKTVITKEEK